MTLIKVLSVSACVRVCMYVCLYVCMYVTNAHTMQYSFSLKRIDISAVIIVAAATLYNMDLRNINLTISNEDIFHFPTSCKHVDEWVGY